MKQYIALAIGLLTSVGVSAQDCTEKAQKLIIDKIKNYNPTDLVPYSEDGDKWALVDAKSKKRITDFILDLPRTFSPNFENFSERCEVNINPDYSFTSKKESITETKIMVPNTINLAIKKDLGFDVNEKGQLTAYFKAYDYIYDPIQYNGKYYAILKKEGEDVLIDQKGVEQEAFRFKEMFSINHKNNGEEVFYVEDKQGKKGFITLSGRKILYGELISPAYNSNLGYSIQKNGQSYINSSITTSGVLDLTTQTWLIKPQKEYKIYEVLYATTEEIEKRKAEHRDKAQIFFLAIDKEGKKHFVLDKKGKPILPKK